MKLFTSLFVDALQIGMVIVAVHISMAKMFAKKAGYKIDAGQVVPLSSFHSSEYSKMWLTVFFPASTVNRLLLSVLSRFNR